MTYSFKNIAFELKYSSSQIDAVYALLDLFECGDHQFSVEFILKEKNLPEDFKKWLLIREDATIIFENHSLPKSQDFEDWELINYD